MYIHTWCTARPVSLHDRDRESILVVHLLPSFPLQFDLYDVPSESRRSSLVLFVCFYKHRRYRTPLLSTAHLAASCQLHVLLFDRSIVGFIAERLGGIVIPGNAINTKDLELEFESHVGRSF